MENKQPSIIDLLIETHVGLERQGPGSTETTCKALGFLGDLEQISNTADLGCGSGPQTMELARHLSGSIVGLDMFQISSAFSTRTPMNRVSETG